MFEIKCFPWIPEFDGADYSVTVEYCATREEAEAAILRWEETHISSFFISEGN
jgi:hypothetical protein